MDQRRTATTAMKHEVGRSMERLTYSVPEVAMLLGVSRSSAYEYVRSGEIPSITLGSRIVVPRHGLEALLNVEAAELI